MGGPCRPGSRPRIASLRKGISRPQRADRALFPAPAADAARAAICSAAPVRARVPSLCAARTPGPGRGGRVLLSSRCSLASNSATASLPPALAPSPARASSAFSVITSASAAAASAMASAACDLASRSSPSRRAISALWSVPVLIYFERVGKKPAFISSTSSPISTSPASSASVGSSVRSDSVS